jgi:hypothetical protein
MKLTQVPHLVLEWFTRRNALRAADASRLPAEGRDALAEAERALELAGLAVDTSSVANLARSTSGSTPSKGSPANARTRAGTRDKRPEAPQGAAVALCREAVLWALTAAAAKDGQAPPLRVADGADPARADSARAEGADPAARAESAEREGRLLSRERLFELAGGESAFASLASLLDAPPVERRASLDRLASSGNGDAADAPVAQAYAFARRLTEHVSGPEVRARALRDSRARRILFPLVVTFLVFVGFEVRDVTTEKARGRTWVASSASWVFPMQGTVGTYGEDGLMFHTQEENAPWVRIDLGSEQEIRRVRVRNRQSCCQERAVPLVVEVGTDGVTWTEVARTYATFDEWEARFARHRARYVRLHVPRRTALHLSNVAVH